MADEYRRTLSASTLIGDEIRNLQDGKLGKLEDIMIELQSGKVAYGVLSFGGLLGMGEKYFAIPWNKLRVDQENKCIILDIPEERLKNSPGFDKDHWPDSANVYWQSEVNDYYK